VIELNNRVMLGKEKLRNVNFPGISHDSLKFVKGFLYEAIDQAHCDFALRWFYNNQNRLENHGISVPQGVSDEWKINAVLTSNIAQKDITKPEYKPIQNRINRIWALEKDITQQQIRPETPFLLLNFLNTSPNYGEKPKLIHSVKKELANKIIGEDISVKAKKIAEAEKEKWFNRKLSVYIDEAIQHTNEEMLKKEWQRYMRLATKDIEKYHKDLRVSGKFYRLSYSEFKDILLKLALKNSIRGLAFYHLLSVGLKPYGGVIRKGFFAKKIVLPKLTGGVFEIKEKEYKFLIKNLERTYGDKISLLAQEKLYSTWFKEHEKLINSKIEEFLEELGKSLENTITRIKGIFKEAKKKMLDEQIREISTLATANETKSKLLKERKFIKKLGLLSKQEKFLMQEFLRIGREDRRKALKNLNNILTLDKEEAEALQNIQNNWQK